MSLRLLFPKIKENKNFKEILSRINESDEQIDVFATSSLRSFLVSSVFNELSQPMLVVVSNFEKSEKFANELSNFLPSFKIKQFPDWEILPHERMSPSKEISSKRIEILSQIKDGNPVVVVAAVQTVMQNLPPLDSLSLKLLKFKVGEEVDFCGLSAWLVEMGYERVPTVETKGDFSVRGGIVDIFSPNMDRPFRIEFYGDVIESIRSFDLLTQLSLSNEESLTVFSCNEISLNSSVRGKAISFLKRLPHKPAWLLEDMERLESCGHFEGVERYAPFLFDKLKNILDYFPPNGLVIFDEEKSLEDEAIRFYEKQLAYLNDSVSSGKFIKPPKPYYLSFEKIKEKLPKRLNLFSVQSSKKDVVAYFKSSSIEPMFGQLDRLKELLGEFRNIGVSIIIAVKDVGRVERLTEILREWNLDVVYEPNSIVFDKVNIVLADLQEGFFLSEFKVLVITESDIFTKFRRFRRDKQTVGGKPLISSSGLNVGDYVVHINHGIGRFEGMTIREVEGVKRDYLLLAYAKEDRLYVPLSQISCVSKYIGANAASPKLSRLGSPEWSRAKKRVKKSVKKLAIDLLSLYAHRAQFEGFTYSKDTVWQKELEEAFPFNETLDQLRAIKEVKKDMERARPMDRLVCGDVGYGKTEVVIRAAFKAAMDGKQTIILVPTTILAQQHLNTFRERFSSYPINVEMLSRFKTPREQKSIIEELKKEGVDVIIGTHRLLQKDVQLRDLGLVVIDEEQRFGVGHKEHLRELRKTVDVLALSATPIPRTLQMSLSGVRDLSVINTPPEDRYPILTKIAQYDEKLIQDAIRREIERGGQVYYVYNKVKSIYRVAEELEKLVPEARIGVGHGQMTERELKKVMLNFLEKRYDVLLCTTIIESGIDIPTANTLIVDGSNKLGLSQMYQLRGRVGRSHHRAYAYFLFPGKKMLTAAAFSRLKTISEFTELGSGIKIAMKDLEIRGAGNLLGPEQHGYMAAVGFELYNQLLREAVEEIRGERVFKRPVEVGINLPVDAFIPRSYIKEEVLRIEAYRLVAFANDLGAVERAKSNLRDRFGRFPLPVKNLIEIAKIKLLANDIGLKKVTFEGERLVFKGISLTERETDILRDKYGNLIYESSAKTLVAHNLPEKDVIFFLGNLFGDIIRTHKVR